MKQASQEEEEELNYVTDHDDPDDALQAAKTLAMFAQHSSDKSIGEDTGTDPPDPPESTTSDSAKVLQADDTPSTSNKLLCQHTSS